MPVYSISKLQRMPCSLKQAWDFFSNPSKLSIITPEDMHFRNISQHHGEQMYPGQVIEYRLRPLFGISVYWMTEITHVVDGRLFVDEQRRGPYSLWHHQHHFREIEGGVEMRDIVHYQLPLGVLGRIAHALLVRGRVEAIFDYRYRKVEEIFGKWEERPSSK